MYEFLFGLLMGYCIRVFHKKPVKNIHTQADEFVIATSQPIEIPKKVTTYF
jgi:hypothetical protein